MVTLVSCLGFIWINILRTKIYVADITYDMFMENFGT